MPVNRNALIRYKTIDKCLQNRYRKWTLEDLIEACSEALYEYEGIDKGVSRRTVQGDIQIMRSDKLGYNAPIVVVDKKYYTYEDPDYSITNIPLSEQDLGRLIEAVEFMKQFQGFSHFQYLDGMVQKLEDHIYSQKADHKPIIDFEKNENLKGLQFLDPLYRAIKNKTVLKLTYQSFKARQANVFQFHPYLLKEFRNRWFVIGQQKKREGILNLALDRIVDLETSPARFVENPRFNAQTYFKDAIGVSVSPNMQPKEVILFVTHKHAPYVVTKPLHHSQKVVERDNFGVTFSLRVQHNFELEKEILAFGDGIKVIAPEALKRKIKDRLLGALDLYETEINESKLKSLPKQLMRKGYSVFNYVYTKREVRKIKSELDKVLSKEDGKLYAQRQLLDKAPSLKHLLFNKNLNRLIKSIDPAAFLVKTIYFDKTTEANWYVTWHQDLTINVAEKKETPGFTGWTNRDSVVSVIPPEEMLKNIFTIRIHLDDTDEKNGGLKVLPGSHTKIFTDEEKQLIAQSSMPFQTGGARRRRVAHETFTIARFH